MLGFLTGSTEDMATSDAFLAIFKKIFDIDNVGLKWSTVNIKNAPKNQSWRDRSAAQIEVDATEAKEKKLKVRLAEYFNTRSRDPTQNFLGTPMMFVPLKSGWQNSPQMSLRIRTQIIGQGAVVASLHSAVLDQVNLTNAIDSEGTTLLQSLIALPSIVTKSNKNGKQIVGRLFHSITPTEDSECYMVSYFAVNAPEASGVLGGREF